MALWLNRAGKYGEHESKFINESKIFLTWENLHEDLSMLKEKEDLQKLLETRYPDFSSGKITVGVGQIWAFSKKMAPGDLVCLPTKSKTIYIGEITGDYKHNEKGPNPYYHFRTVKWLEKDIPRSRIPQDILYSLGSIMTICSISKNDAEARLRKMFKLPGDQTATGEVKETLISDTESQINIDQLARDQIIRLIYSKFKGHGMERLVESILKAQGFTTYNSPKGADHGIDIVASPGIIGFGHPRICVQVKSQDSPIEKAVLNQLIGAMQSVGADQGLLVSWGGFKQSFKDERVKNFFKVRLWDQNDLIDNLLANYDKLDEDIRAEIPLKRIWTVALPEEE